MRRIIFWVHLAAGCVVAAAILFLSVTGCLLTYERQIVSWEERGFRSTGQPTGNRPSLDALLAEAAAEKKERPQSLTVFSRTDAPVVVSFSKKERLLLDKNSGRILGEGAVRTRQFFETLRSLHRYFGVEGGNRKIAKFVKGIFDLSLLGMIVTGLVLWAPGRWTKIQLRQRAVLRGGLKGKAWFWNRHNAIGLWAAVPLTVIVLTGAVMSYAWMTRFIYWATNSPLPSVVAKEKTHKGGKHADREEALTQVSLDQAFRRAAEKSPGWQILEADVPRRGDEMVTIIADKSLGNRPDERSEIMFDRGTGEMTGMEDFHSSSMGAKIRAMMHMVHTGEVGGIVGQTISGLASACCSLLVLTGLWMSLERFRIWRLGSARRKALPVLEEAGEGSSVSTASSVLK